MSDDYGTARIERAAERMAETARPIEPTQPGGEVRDAPPQATPEPARGSRDPAPVRATLPPPIRPGESVTPPTGQANRARLLQRMAERTQGQKRAADTAPDDPRATNTDTPEVEPPRASKRPAEFKPDDPRLTAGGDESEVVVDMPVPNSQPTSHRPANTIDLDRIDRAHECGTCGTGLNSKNALRRHLNESQHHVVDDDENPVIYGCEQDREETRRRNQEQ